MFTVALIGPDGAGKSTIVRRLENSFPLPVKCLYMGINPDSSNVLLPTSRFIEWMKRARPNSVGSKPEVQLGAGHQLGGKRKESGRLWATLRLLNRVAEEWYRQVLSWIHQRRGRIVIYDRHYRFDFEYSPRDADGKPRRFTDWFHRWCLAKLYPRPHLVIYLDAPPEVLLSRKHEGTLESLEIRRQSFLRQGRGTPNFFVVDATLPLDEVYAQVARHIHRFHETGHPPKRIFSEQM